MSTSRSGGHKCDGCGPGGSAGWFKFTTDGSGDPLALTDPCGLVGVITNISESSGTFTITLQDAWYDVCVTCVDNLDATVGYTVAFTAPSTLVLERLTATATIAANASATMKVFGFFLGQ